MGEEKKKYEFELNPEQRSWLKRMAEKYGLPDEHKALRVLIDFAHESGDLDDIFTTVRCRQC